MKCRELAKALELMRRAQSLLDGADAPGEIGCHLDLAICRLKALIRLGTEGQTRHWATADPTFSTHGPCPWDRQIS